MGYSNVKGSAAVMAMYPVVPDYERFEYGRDIKATFGDEGLAGAWLKKILHHMFLYKMKAKPFWSLIPD
jgi:sulfide:quinone oxidoreductase